MNLWPVEYFCPLFFSRSVLIWKKRGTNVFNWSEVHFHWSTSYKIYTLTIKIFFKFFGFWPKNCILRQSKLVLRKVNINSKWYCFFKISFQTQPGMPLISSWFYNIPRKTNLIYGVEKSNLMFRNWKCQKFCEKGEGFGKCSSSTGFSFYSPRFSPFVCFVILRSS